jgi:hypothetical protein
MGHHFVPQRYLRNFEDPDHPGYIWVHDRQGDTRQLAKIEKVAQRRNFYSPSTEKILAEAVERPTNAVIDKLTSNQSVTPAERAQLAYYVAVMMKRIPAHRRHARAMLPEALAGVVNDVREQLKTLANDVRADPEILKRRAVELDEVERKFQARPPREVVEQIREPWPSARIVELLFRMTWRVLISAGPIFFVTTDNPAFYFRSLGLARKESELCIPLSTRCTLHGSSQRAESDPALIRCEQSIVKEVNRRMVSESERLVFYHQPADWILKLFKKEELVLNRIEWQKGYFTG